MAAKGKPTLTNRQRVFVEEYLICWDGAKAARAAGYSPKTARAMAAENLTKPNIKALIEARLKAKAMQSDEVLARLAEQAAGNIGDFFKLVGEGEAVKLQVDLPKILARGHMIKSLKFREDGSLERIEMVDGQAALRDLGRHHRLFTDRYVIADWREEALADGVDPDAIKQKLTEEYVAAIRRRNGAASG